MNRGLARRTMFESADDIAIFLGELGDVSGRGQIEVHAYCMMTTHYHMLVRSPIGQLGRAMQRVQTAYSCWFNRGRDRDGALVRGRYAARRIDSVRYRRAVVAYIDRNPVAARIVSKAEDYPHGSARAYAVDARLGPRWLRREWIESEVREARELAIEDRRLYLEIFGRLPPALHDVVEARTRSRAQDDPLDDLVKAAPARIVAWMRRRAKLADGSRPGLPVLDWSLVSDSVNGLIRTRPDWRIGGQPAGRVMRAGIARQLTAASTAVMAGHEGLSKSAVQGLVNIHRRSMLADRDYASHVGRAVHAALDAWRALAPRAIRG